MSANALSKITLGRVQAPTGNSVVTAGFAPLGATVPAGAPVFDGELGVCELSSEAGSFLSVLKKGVWQNLEGKSLLSKGQVSDPFLLANPDCRVGIIQTENGPLTKGYGDAQLAGVDDVTVRVEGAERAVRFVEPTLGIIVLEQSIQPGSTVEVDYFYTPNPCLPLAEYNNFGYTFNKFGTFNTYSGRFGYDAVFGPPPVTPQPQEYGYTYTAFDANYSAAFNDPTSLLFNEPSNSLTIPPLERVISPSVLAYEGDVLPTSQGWKAIGTAPASPSFEEGLFLVEDTSTGTNVVDPEALAYRFDQDFTFDYITTLNFRTKVFEYTKDGDFTGVSAGWASDKYLYKMAMLEVGSVKIIGMLSNTGDETNWQSYLGLTGTVTSRTVSGSTVNDRIVFGFEPGLFAGDQVFVQGSLYEVASITPQADDPTLYDVLFTTEFGALSGEVQAFRVLDYTALSSYRIFRSEEGVTTVFTGGNPAPFIRVSDTSLPQQEEVYDLLEKNLFYFGSTSKLATSKSGWDFFRASVQPTSALESESRIYVQGEFNVLPDADPTAPWSLLDDQGSAQIVDNEFLNLEQAGRSDQGTLTYGRIEPLLTRRAKAELEARVRVDSFVGGTIPATVTLSDGVKDVTLGLFSAPSTFSGTDYATFRVTEGVVNQDPNSIATEGIISPVDPSSAIFQYVSSYSGTRSLEDEGFTTTGFDALTTSFVDHHQVISKANGLFADATQEFPVVSIANLYTNYVFATRLRFDSVETNFLGRAPVVLGVDDLEVEVFFSFIEDPALTGLVFTSKNGSILADILGDPLGFDFDWNDGEFHSYRMVRSDDVVSLFADGDFLGSVTTADLQTSVNTEHEVKLDLLEEEVTFAVDYLLSHSTEYADRQIGLYNGTGDISDPTAYDVVDAEFLGTFLKIRVTRDPAGKTQVFLNDGATATFERQYSELPPRQQAAQLNTALGYVRFGATDPTSLSETVWDYVRYNITNEREQQLALEHSVFNAAFPVTSAEPIFDTTVEELTLTSDTSTTIVFPNKGFNVRKVLSITSSDGVMPYTFTFNETTQTAILDNVLPQERTDLIVRFLVKAPYSKEYLKNQDPVIKLNDGTPPFELTQERTITQVEEFISQFNDFEDVLNGDIDFTFSDGRLRISFEFNDSSFYNCLHLEQRDLGGTTDAIITPACDSLGFRELTLEGYADTYTVPDQAPDGFGDYGSPFYLDRLSSTLDNSEDRLEPFSEADVTVAYSDSFEDTAVAVTDEALTGAPFAVLTFLGGFVLDNTDTTLDAVADELDDFTTTDVPIDYTAPVNFP
jgi:hypothetical protein